MAKKKIPQSKTPQEERAPKLEFLIAYKEIRTYAPGHKKILANATEVGSAWEEEAAIEYPSLMAERAAFGWYFLVRL